MILVTATTLSVEVSEELPANKVKVLTFRHLTVHNRRRQEKFRPLIEMEYWNDEMME